MARPNAVEISPYRKEIEEMLKEGKPLTFIEEWLKEHGAPISRQAIGRYKSNQFNIPLLAQKKYIERKSKERLDKASDEQVDDIELIDSFISQVDPVVMDEISPNNQVRNLINLLKTKYQILGVIREGQPVNVNVAVNNNSALLEDEEYIAAKKKAMDEYYAQKQGTSKK